MKHTERVLISVALLMGSAFSLANELPLGSDMDCVIEPNTEIELSASVYGVLSEVKVQRGDSVKKGQVVASLTYGTELASVDLAKERVEFGKRKAERNEDLYKDELISDSEKDEMDTEILISKLQLRQAQEQLKLRRVISPINGIVVERDKDPGEYVERESLLTVVSLDPLHVELVAPAENINKVKDGMKAEVRLSGPGEGVYEARVSLVDQIVDAASGTIRIRMLLDNPASKIPAGVNCSVNFKADAGA